VDVDADTAGRMGVAMADIIVFDAELKVHELKLISTDPFTGRSHPTRQTHLSVVDAPATAMVLIETPICLVSVNRTFPSILIQRLPCTASQRLPFYIDRLARCGVQRR